MSLPVTFEIKAVKVGNSIKITIPKEIVRYLKIEKGNTVRMWTDNNHIVIEKKE